ncbi:hypothetical protein Tco_0888681 [Tanacetum coccineum]
MMDLTSTRLSSLPKVLETGTREALNSAELTPTQMILETRRPIETVSSHTGFPSILDETLLRTARALIDVYESMSWTSVASCGFFPSLTPFEEGDFIFEEIEACLTNDSIPPGIDDVDFDPRGDLLLLEKLLNDDPSFSSSLSDELNFRSLKS